MLVGTRQVVTDRNTKNAAVALVEANSVSFLRGAGALATLNTSVDDVGEQTWLMMWTARWQADASKRTTCSADDSERRWHKYKPANLVPGVGMHCTE